MTKGANGEGPWKRRRATHSQDKHMGTPEGTARTWTVKRAGDHDRWASHEMLVVNDATERPELRRDSEDVHECMTPERGPHGRSTGTHARVQRMHGLEDAEATPGRHRGMPRTHHGLAQKPLRLQETSGAG